MAYQRVIAIHDLCGLGHSSLAAALPIISAMGHQVIPLPTSVLSSQTDGFDDFTSLDLTDNMQAILACWQGLNLKVDGVYSGYLGSAEQSHLVAQVARDFVKTKHVVVVDPVLGDNGELYPTMDKTMVKAMQDLIRVSDVVTPNMTELAALCEVPYESLADSNQRQACVKALSAMGPRYVALTSVPDQGANTLSSLAYDRERNAFADFKATHLPAHYPGTGDMFSSVLTGHLLAGDGFFLACEKASVFVFRALQHAMAIQAEPREGIPFEPLLKDLFR